MSEEQRGFVDGLWKQAFAVGTSFIEPHLLFEYNWNFSNLQDAFKEGGVLHGEEKVFVFGQVELGLSRVADRSKEVYVPRLVVVASPFPPSDKIGIISEQASSQGITEEIIDMETVNLGWVPYVPLLGEHERVSSLESPLPQIYIIGCIQREAASKLFELYPSSCCLPYFDHPYMVETEQNTVVDIVYPGEAGTIAQKFDWRFDTPEGFAITLVYEGKLSRDHEDAFKGFVKEKVEEGMRANREAIREQIKDQDELRRYEEGVAAFERMRFYKFYPVATPDTPDLSRLRVKTSKINRYYGEAHQVF